ncbi:MAG TPA: RNA methyltransferase [Tepidisphaeraceae bacterium]|jgi:tRNA G18 (ribose-2'-O)-methylase SpoU|nr:RNA methyltransferase [Tepidisphaeraceae bacterium]
MPVHAIHALDDPLLAPYRNLKDKELARDGGRYIAEGENVVRRLLASGLPVESLLIAQRKRHAIEPLVPAHIPIFVGGDDLIESVIGFEFHSGVLGCGIRSASPGLAAVIPPPGSPALLTVCQEIANTENLGALIRISAAFGADAMMLGERCCDPFFRQSIRVSMGAVFALPIIRSSDLLGDLDALSREFGVQRMAAVLSTDAEPLKSVLPQRRMAIVFGNEAQGLDQATIGHCDRRLTIPMQLGTDSLNVAVAAAVFLFHLTETSSPPNW